MDSFLVSVMQSHLRESLAAIRELIAWEAARKVLEKASSQGLRIK